MDPENSSTILQKLYTEIEKINNTQFEFMVIGNSNSGKSTFLNKVTNFNTLLNMNTKKETLCKWSIIYDS